MRETTLGKKRERLTQVPSRRRFRVVPATPGRWKDVARLFGPRGACGGCWCMFWRRPPRVFIKGKGAGNRRALQTLVKRGDPAPGVLAYDGEEPVGWCAVAPREAYLSLGRSRVLKPVDDQPVWSISCFFVKREYRRRGLSRVLLDGAVAFARSKGAQIVEGYPTDSRAGASPDPFIYTGITSTFVNAGFAECARRSKFRPIMRLRTARR